MHTYLSVFLLILKVRYMMGFGKHTFLNSQAKTTLGCSLAAKTVRVKSEKGDEQYQQCAVTCASVIMHSVVQQCFIFINSASSSFIQMMHFFLHSALVKKCKCV